MSKKIPVVLFIAEGINISSSWRGNSLLSSQADTIFDLWKKYPHTLLESTSNPYDDESDFATMAFGQKIISNDDFLNKQIKNNSLEKSENLNALLSNTHKNKAALHLIGMIDMERKEETKLRLFELINLAKRKRVYRAYLHLILKDDYHSDPRELLSLLDEIDQNSQKVGIGEIASITGINHIKNCIPARDFKKSLQSIINGSGLHALTFEQAIILHTPKSQILSDKQSVSIIHQDKAIGKINTFDSVIFFDCNTNYLSDFILALSQKSLSRTENFVPECLTVATFFQSIDQDFNNVAYLFNKYSDAGLCSNISKNNLKQYIITDSTRIQHVNLYLLNNNSDDNITTEFIPTKDVSNEYFENYAETLNDMANKIVKKIEEDKYDLFIINIPALYHACLNSSFAQSCRMLKLIDKLLKKISAIIFKLNGALIITSINNSKLIESKNNTFFHPFIFAMEDLAKTRVTNSSFQNQIMTSLLKKKQSIENLCPTIYDIFNLKVEDKDYSKTLLDKHILY